MSTVYKLDFNPRCFSEIDGKFVSGSLVTAANATSNVGILNNLSAANIGPNIGNGSNWRGLFSFFNRETQDSLTIRLGSYINNSVTINKVANGQYSSYVCNNDMSLYNTEISNSRISVLDSISLDFPLNNSILSDDHKNLIAVGDCSNIYLLHPQQEGSHRLTNDNTIETNCDSGFSTSFDSSGLHFATCFQDGTCLIYDLRNYSKGPMKQIYSTRKNTASGAFRCAKYSRGTDDLLVISEHVGRVHVIDTRDFNNHQVIMLPMNSAPTISTRGISSSSSNLNEIENNSNFTPKILNYNDVLDYEGTFNPNNGFYNRNNYNSRSLNNFNVLMALNQETNSSSDSDSDTIDTDLRNMYPSTSNTMVSSEFDYTDNDISGVDWYEDDSGSHIIIGYDRGLINWDIDSWSRRSFPSFSLA